jgi:parallel beta-helix repeat protein
MKATVCLGCVGALACAVPAALASTNVGGPILTHTTWDLAGSPYIVTSSVIVGNGATLTIEPGVEVRFNPGLGLTVGYAGFPPNGKLVARGTSGSPILFTSNTTQQPGAWARIHFTDYAVDAVYDAQGNYVSGSILEHVTIEYAGAGTNVAAVTVESSSPGLDHVRVHDSTYRGISIVTGSAPIERIRDCEIWNIAGDGLYVSGGTAGHVITGNYVHDCADRGMGLASACSASGNTIVANGDSGVYIGGAGTTLIGNTVAGNMANFDGGGIKISASNCTLTGNTITNNSAYYGGGVYVTESNCALVGNTITGNTATGADGGGVRVAGSNCTLTGNLIMNNAAPNGGAIWFNTQMTTMSRCLVAGNHSTGLGAGAVYILNYPVNLGGDPNSGAYNIISCNDATYQIYNAVPFNASGANDVHAEYVRWRSNDPQDISAYIYDFFDDASKSTVLWHPLVARVPGDMNCDGAVDFDDINPFVLALTGFDAYYAAYPDCNWYHADCDGDCAVDFYDINVFVALLSGS